MKELLEVIAKYLVDFPDAVEVTEKSGEQAVVLELHVAEGDMGKVIGKKGRIAQSIRAVMQAAASRENTRVIVEIV
ncbi:MAG: KH domain-containing protein [Clostridia bacterium]|nr:KH domain-containing protein [Clostridia bacterium]